MRIAMSPTTNSDESICNLPFECNVVPDTVLQKAKSEFGETVTKRQQCVKQIRKMIIDETTLYANVSDNFLLRFLRMKKFDTDGAFKVLKKYYKHRVDYPSLYCCYTPNQNLKILGENMMTFLPFRNPEGSAIFVVKPGQWNPLTTAMEEVLRVGLLCYEKALYDQVTQICGIIEIIDLKDFSRLHLFNLSPSSIRCFVSSLQGCMPIRHKEVHIINHPRIFSILFALIKPLVIPKLRKRIHFHGDNLSSLHEYIPPLLLPEEYGGTQKAFRNDSFFASLLNSEAEFEENNKYGYKDD